jgi:hypothetical protein
MRHFSIFAFVILLLLLCGPVSCLDIVPSQREQWSGNGHYYGAVLVSSGITWDQAKMAAIDRGGHLATISSEEENQFVYDLFKGDERYWYLDSGGNSEGPWLGAYQPSDSDEPAGGWTWVTGEPFLYGNWASNQPDNSQGLESRLNFFNWGSSPSPMWNDISDNFAAVGYIIEWDAPVTTQAEEIFSSNNIQGVYSNPTAPTVFTINRPFMVTYVMDYHYRNQGELPGTISLRHTDGTTYGPWQTSGREGQGGVPNAYWEVWPYAIIKPGTYTILDSNPETWSQNQASGGRGMSEVKGVYLPDSVISGEEFAVLSSGWDIFGDPLSNGDVSWTVLDDGKLLVSFRLSGAQPNHKYIVGAHFFDPSDLTKLPKVEQSGGWKLPSGGIITREGNTANPSAWDFGYLITDGNGDGKAQFVLAPSHGIYYVQFTVRIGPACIEGETSGCGAVYRTGEKFGERFEMISI